MIHKVWVLQCLVLTLKCLSTLSKTLVPISLAEHHHLGNHSGHRDTLNNNNMDMDALEETYAASYENALFGVLILSILYNWFFTKPPSLYLGLIAVLLQVRTTTPIFSTYAPASTFSFRPTSLSL